MHLRTVELRDWKAYEDARFDFPEPSADRNVILIGGKNGFGKTTFFEALVLGLYGRDGLPLISRVAVTADDSGKLRSFSDFIERALNGRAIANGRTECRIRLTFQDESGQPIVIERKWFFTNTGRLRQGTAAEEVMIFKGHARRTQGPPASYPDPHSWYRDWISRNFLPTHLAGFFLFDGEASSAYADRDMGQQVRDGIEGLLGLTWLRKLKVDLIDYARSRLAEVPKGVNDDSIRALQGEIEAAKRDVDVADATKRELTTTLADAEAERQRLTRELGGYGSSTRAQLADLIEARARHERNFGDAEDKLQALAASSLPLALVGPALRERVADRLAREASREAWLASRDQGFARVDGVLASIETELPLVRPPLSLPQQQAVREALRAALDRLWSPPPSEAADDFRHGYARGPMSQRLRARLEEAGQLTRGTVANLIETLRREGRALRMRQDEIAAAETPAPDLDAKKARLIELNKLIGGMLERKALAENMITSRRPQLEQKHKDLALLTAKLDQTLRPARNARRANEIAQMLDGLIEEAWTMQTTEVAEAMTAAVRAMAHRSDLLNRVDITADGVELLAPDGNDLRQYDLSAGEKQIFTQALFAAIAQVSGRIFPLVIDTPLGRLDEAHRINVLRYLSGRDGQVFLISTNTEVVDRYLDAIRPRVAKAYRIDNTTEGNMGYSIPVEGYFAGQGF